MRGDEISIGDPRAADVRVLRERHLEFANSHSPPEDVRALDTDALLDPEVTFFMLRRHAELLAVQDGRLRAIVVVPAGGHHDLVLEISDRPLPGSGRPRPGLAGHPERLAARRPGPGHLGGPRDARHAYAVLQGLTGPGGMVAAATLGLPERTDAGRNYDYRYVWLRDQSYAGVAASVDRPHPLLDSAVHVATARLLAHGDRIAPAYRVDGGALPVQSTLRLPGYPGGSDVSSLVDGVHRGARAARVWSATALPPIAAW